MKLEGEAKIGIGADWTQLFDRAEIKSRLEALAKRESLGDDDIEFLLFYFRT
jgi:hypothetical protein